MRKLSSDGTHCYKRAGKFYIERDRETERESTQNADKEVKSKVEETN